MFFYNACDTLRNIPEILQTALQESHAAKIPFFNIHLPQTNIMLNVAQNYLKKEINQLINELEKAYNVRFSADSFAKSVNLFQEYRKLMVELKKKIAIGRITFASFVQISDSIATQPVEEKITLLRDALTKIPPQSKSNLSYNVQNRPRIVLSGILPPPISIINVIENAGLQIAENDIASLSRSYQNRLTKTVDPAEYYADFYQNHYPCPTLLASADKRIEKLLTVCDAEKVNGLIFIGEKYCEYEYFEIPYVKKELNKKGIKTLELEFHVDINDKIDNYKTRIEAFASLLRNS